MKIHLAVVTSLLAVAGAARALPSPGTCGGAMTGTVAIGVPDGDGSGNFQVVQASSVPYVFGAAECDCDTRDLQLAIGLSQPLPASTSASVEVWVGFGCDDVASRGLGSPPNCERVATLPIAALQNNANVFVPVPSRALFSPGAHQCPSAADASALRTNGIYLFVFTDPANPLAACYLSMTENAQPPTAPATTTATRDSDGAVTLGWTPPAAGRLLPKTYQVLCADSDGNPATTRPNAAAYSVCEAGVMHRRLIPTGGILRPLSSSSRLTPETAPSLSALDPAFVCSDAVSAGATTAKVDGLDPKRSYQLQLVAVDSYGNVTAADAVSVGPAPPAPPMMGAVGCAAAGQGGADASRAALLAFALAVAVAGARRRGARSR